MNDGLKVSDKNVYLVFNRHLLCPFLQYVILDLGVARIFL